MKESYGKGLARHLGPEPYADGGDAVGVALARGTRRLGIELRNHRFARRPCNVKGKATRTLAILRRAAVRRGGVEGPKHE
jgi:hypothetical protein